MTSPGDLPLLLSPRAKADFADILQYTLEIWGEAQALAYESTLDKALAAIHENPRLGHGSPALSASHRVLPAGRHIIIYRITDTSIQVSRILHGRMDAHSHLDQDL